MVVVVTGSSNGSGRTITATTITTTIVVPMVRPLPLLRPVQEDCLTLEDGTDRVSRKVGN